MKYWLLKSEPGVYSWSRLKQDVITKWDGIRNYQARNYMLDMTPDDLCFFYHSGKNPMIIGIAEVINFAYKEENHPSCKFFAIDIRYYMEMKNTVSLKEIKSNPDLQDMKILKQSRLSVSPLTKTEWTTITLLSNQ